MLNVSPPIVTHATSAKTHAAAAQCRHDKNPAARIPPTRIPDAATTTHDFGAPGHRPVTPMPAANPTSIHNAGNCMKFATYTNQCAAPPLPPASVFVGRGFSHDIKRRREAPFLSWRIYREFSLCPTRCILLGGFNSTPTHVDTFGSCGILVEIRTGDSVERTGRSPRIRKCVSRRTRIARCSAAST